MEDDVIRLPFPRLPGCIHQRRVLFVDGAGLAVVVGVVLVRVEDLHLVALHQKNAAVAAFLTFALNYRGRRPLYVQLRVAELVSGDHVAGPWHDLYVTITNDPFRRSASGRS